MESSVCSMCGEGEETTFHLFCTCRVTWLVWSKCYEWVGKKIVVHQESKMFFSQFRLIEEIIVVNRIWLCVWITFIGELWKYKNKEIFRNGRVDHLEIFSMAQLKVWSLVASKVRLACFSYSD